MAKFNAKKLFKGLNTYGYSDGKYSYAVGSGYIAVKVLRDSKIHDAIAKDVEFVEFDERHTKEKVSKAIDPIFDPDIKEVEAKRLRLDVETNLGQVYLFGAIKGNHGSMGVQGRWVDALGDLKDWTVYFHDDAVKFYGQGAEIAFMRYKFEDRLAMAEVEAFEAEIEKVKNYLEANK